MPLSSSSIVHRRAEAHLLRSGLIEAGERLLAFANAAVWRPGSAGVALTDRRLLRFKRRSVEQEIPLERLSAYSLSFRPGRVVLRMAVEGEGVSSFEVPGGRHQTTQLIEELDRCFGSRRPRVSADEPLDLSLYRGRPLAALIAHSLRVSMKPDTRVLGMLRDEGQGRELLTACHWREGEVDHVATVRFGRAWDAAAIRGWLYFLHLTRSSDELRNAQVDLLAPEPPPSPFDELAKPGARSSFLPRALYARRPGDPSAATDALLSIVGSIEGRAYERSPSGIREVARWIERHLRPEDHAVREFRAASELLAAAIGTLLVESGRAEWLPERGRYRAVRIGEEEIALEDEVRERLREGQPIEELLNRLGEE